MPKKCVVLLSGGIDSSTALFYAKSRKFTCRALIFDYGQRHKKEIRSAIQIAKAANVPYQIIKIKLPWKGSSLLDTNSKIPETRSGKIGKGIPSTYVPGRNTIFLSFAISFAEAIGAEAIFIGANAIDFSGYPDCRPSYYKVFNKLIREGTKARNITITTPLINMKKSDIIRLGLRLGVPYNLTWSCYKGGRRACGVCDSCTIRQKGFKEALKGR
jgi:7-cyano-7-deazaguanine synthase